ncbi:response regulator [Pseudozobellia thermophila]|uniref:CheY chemotaxis protein or a CheY-like REC (Receiver) domain n=1 Tax=Pseudozobellia thermophila TaxID=192903 RepID=A0A1M6JV79_9FLAO|nr:response regulator [Pseudozobellia thermophila]SHJ50597.1 CheY chemotaxis protein or a CheY-like REC (receiver) domain [Pseudozobellia thermophila]
MELKILIVEDNFIIQMFLEETLANMGHSVLGSVDTGNDTLSFIETNRPNMIFLDIGLSGSMTGIELADTIKKNYNIPFIFLTANSDRPTLEKAKKTQPLHIISKPIDEDRLKEEVGAALEKLRKQDISNPNA